MILFQKRRHKDFASQSRQRQRRHKCFAYLEDIYVQWSLVSVFHVIIQSLLDYASPVFLNAGSFMDALFISLRKRAFHIIHGSHNHCHTCNFSDVDNRRLQLSMKLFNHTKSSASHVLHDLVLLSSFRSEHIYRVSRKSGQI